jgi:hypothetical protein
MVSAASYMGFVRFVRALPNTLTAGPSSASVPKPSTNSAWIRRTRHGSVWTQSLEPLPDSSRWSVVVGCRSERRRMTGPWFWVFDSLGTVTSVAGRGLRQDESQRTSASRQMNRSSTRQCSSSACAWLGFAGP